MSDVSDDSFWQKLKAFAVVAGREVVRLALQLFYAARAPETPAWAKAVIYGALAYFILPVDAIPDLVPMVGFSDDLGALASAVATVAAHITPEIKERADAKLTEWFS